MATQDPAENRLPGEMHKGDFVVVTEYCIYWIDATTRGGLLSGEWPLRRHHSKASFAYVVGSHAWAPNFLLPGSNGGDAVQGEGDEGLGVRVIASGGSDGSLSAGIGTFDPHGSSSLVDVRQVDDELVLEYSGYLTQEYNGTQTLLDSSGDTALIRYVLIYTFYDANNPKIVKLTAPSPHKVSIQLINRIQVELTPENTTGPCAVRGVHCIHLSVFGIGDDLEFLPIDKALPDLYMLSSEDTLHNYLPTGCPAEPNWPPDTFVPLCNSTPAGDLDFVQEPTTLPTTVPLGDETLFCTPKCARSMTYIHPKGFLRPARDAAVYNAALNVIAVETQYFNVDDPVQTWTNGRTIDTGEDQLIQVQADG